MIEAFFGVGGYELKKRLLHRKPRNPQNLCDYWQKECEKLFAGRPEFLHGLFSASLGAYKKTIIYFLSVKSHKMYDKSILLITLDLQIKLTKVINGCPKDLYASVV